MGVSMGHRYFVLNLNILFSYFLAVPLCLKTFPSAYPHQKAMFLQFTSIVIRDGLDFDFKIKIKIKF